MSSVLDLYRACAPPFFNLTHMYKSAFKEHFIKELLLYPYMAILRALHPIYASFKSAVIFLSLWRRSLNTDIFSRYNLITGAQLNIQQALWKICIHLETQ